MHSPPPMPRPALILDLDGTLCLGDRPLPGACEAVATLQRRGHRLVVLSNTLDPLPACQARLERLGLDLPAQAFIPLMPLLLEFLQRELPGRTLFPLAEPALTAQLEGAFRLSERPEEIEVVLAGPDPGLDHRRLTIGLRALRRGARFIATNLDPTCPTPDGEVPDAGAVVGALEAATGRRVQAVVGKPSRRMAAAALEALQVPPEQAWLVGDSLVSDIRMARRTGMTGVLVLSGTTCRQDLRRAPAQPHHVLDSLADLPALLDRFPD